MRTTGRCEGVPWCLVDDEDRLRALARFRIKQAEAAASIARASQNRKDTHTLSTLLQAPSANALLDGLVARRMADMEGRVDTLSEWDALENDLIVRGLETFCAPAMVKLAASLFYFRLHVDELYEEPVDHQTLSLAAAALSGLYATLEAVCEKLRLCAAMRGLTVRPDYLFHGLSLPEGVDFQVDDETRTALMAHIRKLATLPDASVPVPSGTDFLTRLWDAYKFWFCPFGLLDAVMTQPLLQSEDATPEAIAVLFHGLSTTRCLNLYGYFANKDTVYLLRTLEAVVAGHAMDWLPTQGSPEIQAAQKALTALRLLMEGLREALQMRRVNTAPFSRAATLDHLTPGRRNRDAILQLFSEYAGSAPPGNAQMEQLFTRLEQMHADRKPAAFSEDASSVR